MPNANFKPKKNAKTTLSSIQLEETISSISADLYKRSLSTMSRALDPEHSTNTDLVTFSETGRSTTVFKPKIVKDLSLTSGFFKIVAFPRFLNPLAMTDEAALAPTRMLGSRSYSLAPATQSSDLQPPGKPTLNPCSLIPSLTPQTLPAMILNGYDVPGLHLPYFADGVWKYTMAGPVTVFVSLETSTSFVSLKLHNNSTSIAMTSNVVNGAVEFTAGTTAADPVFWITLESTGDSRPIRLSSIQVTRLTAIPDVEFLHYQNSQISDTVMDAADDFICSGMSLWTQYTGSDLVNSGEIAGYRFPPFNLTPFASLEQSYQNVSSTPGALVGQLKHGAYGFYLPTTLSELSFVPLDTYEHFGCLCVVGRKTEPTATLRVNFNQHLLVSTTNQAFSKQIVPCDPAAVSLALTLLRLSSPVMANDGHRAKINKALSWMKRHEKEIKNGLVSTAKLAKVAAPALAALIV